MDSTNHKNWLIGALLCVALALPALFVGEHLHESSSEEINCDLCLHTILATIEEGIDLTLPVFAKHEEKRLSKVIPLEQFRLFEHPRGPPVLC